MQTDQPYTKKGKVVGKYNLKADGTLTVTDLPMGRYHLKRIDNNRWSSIRRNRTRSSV